MPKDVAVILTFHQEDRKKKSVRLRSRFKCYPLKTQTCEVRVVLGAEPSTGPSQGAEPHSAPFLPLAFLLEPDPCEGSLRCPHLPVEGVGDLVKGARPGTCFLWPWLCSSLTDLNYLHKNCICANYLASASQAPTFAGNVGPLGRSGMGGICRCTLCFLFHPPHGFSKGNRWGQR